LSSLFSPQYRGVTFDAVRGQDSAFAIATPEDFSGDDPDVSRRD
jgi:hypothetical protein